MQVLTIEAFAPRANETFSLDLGDSAVEMTLVNVGRLKPHVYPGMRRDPFRLLFKCAKQTILPQQTYCFRNPAMGTLPIFIVPVGRERDGVVYEAVFN